MHSIKFYPVLLLLTVLLDIKKLWKVSKSGGLSCNTLEYSYSIDSCPTVSYCPHRSNVFLNENHTSPSCWCESMMQANIQSMHHCSHFLFLTVEWCLVAYYMLYVCWNVYSPPSFQCAWIYLHQVCFHTRVLGYLRGKNVHTVCASFVHWAALTKTAALLWILIRNMFAAIWPGWWEALVWYVC